ncbi:hypothetical protein, partial [uncultured Campylobacter sp.]|uniref:beta strand repeat-containing protein n=1 Tax=uncultured Campylobacter sp. TaxID=218934 RepID=UPI00262AE306
MKDSKIPIISGLSLAACLAIAPSQALAGNGIITVTKSDGTPSQLYKSSGENYSGGFESKANAHGQNDNNIVTIRGVASGGVSTWNRTIYGGGNGDGTNLGQGFLYEQVTSANNNILNVNNGATVAILVGGEGKGAQNNKVNLDSAEVHYVVLGGNGTWYGRASNSGDAIHNIVNVSGATKIYYKNFNNFNSTSLMGGRATGTNQANNNEVNISGTPIIVGRVAGAAVENGGADGNKVNITGVVNLVNVNGVIAAENSAAILQNNVVTIDNNGAKVTDVLVANGTGGGITGGGGKATAKNNHGWLKKGEVGNINGAYMVSKTIANHSTIEGGHVTNYAYGSYYRNDAHNLASNSQGDYVTISDGTVDKAIYGAFTYYGDIDGAHVNMSGGKVTGANSSNDDGVYGGLSYDGKVNNSYLELTGGQITGDAIGGRSNNKDVANNYAKINGNAKIGGRLIGGESRSGTVTNSYLDLTGGEIGQQAIGGKSKTGASNNKVTSTGTTFKKRVTGGESSNGAVTGSRVFLTSSKVGENIYGGNAAGGKAEDNHVKLRGNNVVTGEIYGGTSTTNDASRNIVDIEDGEVGGTIFGGRGVNSFNNTVNLTRTHAKNQVNGGGVNTSGGSVHDNKVTLDGAKADGIVSGGQANSGDAAKNIVTAQNNSKINSVIGGQSSSGAAKLNEVHLNDSAVTKEIYGGYSISNNAEENIVNLTNTTANHEVYGGLSSQKAADKNTVKLNGGEAKKNVWGGHGRTGTSQNTVTIEGGAQVAGSALGAEATAGSATNNTVNVDSGKVTGDVKGAKASGSATNNSVNLKGTARVDGNVYAADASSGSGNSVNFHSGSVGGTIYGLSNTSGANNSLNVYNASTQKTAGDIANLNVLNFNGISNANGSAATAALNLTTAGNTDINNAKFQLNGIDYDPSNDSYGSLNIEDGKEYYLIKNGGDYSNFKEKAKQQTNVFNITDASTYEISLKGMLKSTDNHSIFIQGVKDTKRNISSDKNFDSEEVLKYDPDLTAGTIINVGKAGENKNFNGLDINTVNTDPAKPIKATVTLVEGNNIGTITGDDDDTLKIGKDDGSMTPGSIEAENIAGFKKIDFNLPNNYNGNDPALKLTGSTITDLSQTNVNVNTNNLDDNKDYKLISKDNGTINFTDRSTQKDQVYTITDKDHYQYDGETFRKQNADKELVYRKGTITDAWIDNGFDSGELTKNQASNDAQAGAHKLFGNKNNTVNVSQSAGDLNGKNISSGRADVKDSVTPNTVYNNKTIVKGGTNFGNVNAGYGDSGTQEVHHNELSFEDSSKGAVVNGNISAGYSLNGNVHDNTVTTNDTTINGNAYGGEAANGNADANTITLNDGKVTGDVKGAKASGSATNNSVNLKGTARVDGNVYAADASSGSGNSVNFHSGSVGGTIYGLSNTSGANNSLNVYNASTQKTAGDIANLNVLNFNGISNANGSAATAALNLTTAGNTDINNAKFQLNGIDYDPSNDSYGSLNIEEGKEYYLIHNAGNTFTNFTEKAKQTTREFTLKNSTTYDIMLKGLIKSSDDQSILIQGSKLTSRKISNDGKFDGGEIKKYGNIPNPVINVVNEDPSTPTDFNGLDIDGGNNSTVNLTGGNNIGDITGGAGSTLNVGKDTTNPAAPNSITAKNIGGFDDINIFMPPTVKDGDSMIKLTDPTANTDLSNMRGKITAYVSGNTDVGDTSTIHLIDKQGSGQLLLPDPSHLQTRVQQGATIEYETYGMVDANGRALDLRFSGKRRVKDDTKSFAETRAASLASLKSG